MNLAALQRDFRDRILGADDGAVTSAPVETRRGLRVYRHAYRQQLIDTLRDLYEKTAAWLGDDAFTAAAATYVDAHPPSGWTLGDYGQDFVGMLRDLHPEDPEIAELAWLDRALRGAFYAADDAPVSTGSLASVDWSTAGMGFAAAVQASVVRTNVVALWHAMADGTMPPAAESGAAGGIVIWRDQLMPRFRTAAVAEATAIILLRDGLSFAETCAVLERDHAAAGDDIGAMFASWLRDGLVTRVE